MSDNLYNWQFYIQESEAKEEKRRKKSRADRRVAYKQFTGYVQS
jgi:hypothetical protein